MNVALVANEKSGSAGAAGEVDALLRGAGADVEPIRLQDFCDGPSSVDEERLEAVAKRLGDGAVGRIVVAGGDGSLGPAALLALRAGLTLAVVPTGTANSFARWLGLPLDVEEAASLAASADPVTMTAEVASADGRPFVNVASTGLAVLAAHGARPLKARLGPLAYAAGAVKAGATGHPIATAVRAHGEEAVRGEEAQRGVEAWRGRAWQIAVAASGAFGGDSNTGGVNPRDSKLDVAVVEAGSRRKLVRHAFAMSRGRLVREDDVRHIRARTVELDLPRGTDFNVDGEIIALERARFEVVGTVAVVAGPSS
jgi:diacylglycerol kinase (ATP)